MNKDNDNLNEVNKQNDIFDNLKENENNETEIKESNSSINQDISEETKIVDKEKSLEVESTRDNKTEESKNNNKRVNIIVIISIIIIFILLISTIFAILNIDNNNIINGIFIEKVNLSNLKKENVNTIVNQKLEAIEEIELQYGEYNTTVKLSEIGIEIDAKEALNKAINLGKSNNIIIDNYSILTANLFKLKLELAININDEKLNETIKNIQAELPEAVKEYAYEIDGDELIITNGKAGKAIDVNKFKEEIINNVKAQFNGNIEKVNLQLIDTEPKKIDIQEIYNNIYKEAKDAYILEEPFELHKEEDGVDFGISIDEINNMLSEDKETYTISLNITKAKVSVQDLGDKLFKQTLSKYTTIYDAGNTNRASNIALAAKTIDGTILLPGETFSYNGKLGNTTKEKGYKTGGAYVDGRIVQAYGGGICQLSTTLYNAALYANLEIVERHNHTYSVSYVPAGRDATVSYGGKDFKFKNTRSYPIRINSNAKNGVVNISISGIKEDKEYEVALSSSVLSTIPCSTTYENNGSMEEGKEKVIQAGHAGQKSITYKTVKYNGTTISKTVLSKDTYSPMNKIVQVGTKKSANTETNKNVVPATTPLQEENSIANEIV